MTSERQGHCGQLPLGRIQLEYPQNHFSHRPNHLLFRDCHFLFRPDQLLFRAIHFSLPPIHLEMALRVWIRVPRHWLNPVHGFRRNRRMPPWIGWRIAATFSKSTSSATVGMPRSASGAGAEKAMTQTTKPQLRRLAVKQADPRKLKRE